MQKEGKLGIIGAMASEVDSLKEAAGAACTLVRAQMEFCEGRLGEREVVIVQCGVGKVNAALCVQILADAFGVSHIVNTGVAGSLCEAIEIGDLVICTEAVQHDHDVSFLGYAKGEIPGLGGPAFPADPALCEKARGAARAMGGFNVFEGRVCTGDQFIGTGAQRQAIIETFGGLCAEMEGGAIAQACTLNGIPFVIIRAISDKIDGSGSVGYAEFEKVAAARCAEVVRLLAEA